MKKTKRILVVAIAFILIQALLLTQMDFALAATNYDRQSYQLAAFKAERIKQTNTTSLISGVTGVTSVLNISFLGRKIIICLLKGSGSSLTKLKLTGEVRYLGKEIYKGFICNNYKIENNNEIAGFFRNNEDKRDRLQSVITEDSTGPPILKKIAQRRFSKPNC